MQPHLLKKEQYLTDLKQQGFFGVAWERAAEIKIGLILAVLYSWELPTLFVGAGFSRTIWEVSGVNTMQTVQNQQCYSHALCHEERALLPLFSYKMMPYRQGFLSLEGWRQQTKRLFHSE